MIHSPCVRCATRSTLPYVPFPSSRMCSYCLATSAADKEAMVRDCMSSTGTPPQYPIFDVGEPPLLPTCPGPVGDRDRLALTLWGRLKSGKNRNQQIYTSSKWNVERTSMWYSAGRYPYIPVGTLCPRGCLNTEGFSSPSFFFPFSGKVSTGE